MRGTEVADRAQASRPALKVLLVSGGPTSDIGPSGRPFLAKPFTIEALANAVRDVLASPSAFARPRGGPHRRRLDDTLSAPRDLQRWSRCCRPRRCCMVRQPRAVHARTL